MIGTGEEVIPALKDVEWFVGSASTMAEPAWGGGRISNDATRERVDYVVGLLATSRVWYPVPLPTCTSVERDEHSENATDYRARPQDIDQRLERLFEAAMDETFEDGVESHFSRGLELLITRHGEGH